MVTVVCVEYLMTTVVCEKYQMTPVVCDKYQMATIVRMTNDNPWCPGHQASQGSFPVLQYLMFYTQQGNTVLDILYSILAYILSDELEIFISVQDLVFNPKQTWKYF